MIEKFCDLVMGEDGFLVRLRCNNVFDEDDYKEIKSILKQLVEEWKQLDAIPKKAFLTIVELIEFLSRNSNFLTKEDSIKVEDASIEIKDIINELY